MTEWHGLTLKDPADATSSKVTTGDIVTISAWYWNGCWGDYPRPCQRRPECIETVSPNYSSSAMCTGTTMAASESENDSAAA